MQNGGAGAVPVFEGAATMAIPDFMQEWIDAIRLSIQSTDGMAVQTIYSNAEDRLKDFLHSPEEIAPYFDEVSRSVLEFGVRCDRNSGKDESGGSAVEEARRAAFDAIDALEAQLQTVRLAAQPER